MKVYFTSTIKAKKKLEENFKLIYKTIEDLGYKNVTDFLLKVDPEKFYSRSSHVAEEHYEEMFRQIKNSDVVVFEASVHSLGMGYLVNLVLEMGKPVILLHTKESSPFLFKFIKNEKLQILEYSGGDLKEILQDALEEAKQMMSVRFTFFVTPKIIHFLDWVAKKKKEPRAVYIRKLIEKAIKSENYKDTSPF